MKLNNTALPPKTNIVYVVLLVLMSVLYAYFVKYIRDLQAAGCKCAFTWHKDFLFYGYSILLLMTLGRVIVALFRVNHPMVNTAVQLISAFVGIPVIVVTFMFIRMLKAEACECSQDLARTIMEVVNYIQLFLFFITFIVALVISLSFKFMAKKLA